MGFHVYSTLLRRKSSKIIFFSFFDKIKKKETETTHQILMCSKWVFDERNERKIRQGETTDWDVVLKRREQKGGGHKKRGDGREKDGMSRVLSPNYYF